MDKQDLFADLHIHSIYSDGTFTLEEICDMAVCNNVGVIAVTDHNTIAGVKALQKIAKEKGLCSIAGVELDSLYNGKRCHILAYKFDPDSKELAEVAAGNKSLLDATDINTLNSIAVDYSIDMGQYDSFVFDKNLGGWKLIQFLVAQGVAENLDVAVKLMKQYKKRAEFPPAEKIIDVIHRAGGVAILAHPGETFRVDGDGDEVTDALIMKLVDYGIDGMECYYPRHKLTFEKRLENICTARGLYRTVGSDYHGDFFRGSKQKIGCEFKQVKELELKTLLDGE